MITSGTDQEPSNNEPWYKQFWPWFLIALPASVVVAGIATLFIAINNPVSMVSENYYQDGLAINKDLAQYRLATQLNVGAHIQLQNGQLRVKLSSLATQKLVMVLSHPTESAKDLSFDLQLQGRSENFLLFVSSPDGVASLSAASSPSSYHYQLKLIGTAPEGTWAIAAGKHKLAGLDLHL